MADAKTVRAWAAAEGYDVGVRGRIAPAIWEAFATAHGGQLRDNKPTGLWNCKCGRQWAGRVEAHCCAEGCHRHFSTPTNFDKHRVGDPGRCVDPEKRGLKIRASIFGPIYVGDGEYYRTAEGTGLFDN